MHVYRIDNRNYYLASDVKDKYPQLFKGVKNSMPKFLIKYELTQGNEYIYMQEPMMMVSMLNNHQMLARR